MGSQWHTIFWAPESLQMLTTAMKLKDACSYGKVLTNLDNMCKSWDITLPTEVHLFKTVVFPVVITCVQAETLLCQQRSIYSKLVFPVVIYGCESWAIKKAEHWTDALKLSTDAFELWCWRRLLRVLRLQEDPLSPSQRQSVLNIWWRDSCRSRNCSTLATWCEELPHLKRPWC